MEVGRGAAEAAARTLALILEGSERRSGFSWDTLAAERTTDRKAGTGAGHTGGGGYHRVLARDGGRGRGGSLSGFRSCGGGRRGKQDWQVPVRCIWDSREGGRDR